MLVYIGFTIVPGGREYNFSVPNRETPTRSFTVTIPNAVFRPGLLKFQEAPGICYGKLVAALAIEEADTPLSARQQVTELEVSEYQASGKAKVRKWTDEQRLAARQRMKAARAGGFGR